MIKHMRIPINPKDFIESVVISERPQELVELPVSSAQVELVQAGNQEAGAMAAMGSHKGGTCPRGTGHGLTRTGQVMSK